MPLIYEDMIQGKEKSFQVTGYDGTVRDLFVPEQVDGIPVRSIGSHAFADRKDMKTAVLPENLKTIRSFAFYDCTSLSSMELYNTTDDYYDGVIRQCPALRLIMVHCVRPDDYIIVREMLRDVDVTLSFRLFTKNGMLRLTFPEYVSEAREDTMARAIHFTIEGAGMAYRECVGKKSLDLFGYDRLLPRLTDYDFKVAAEIALGRLACPIGLSEKARAGYEDFLREHDKGAVEMLIREEDHLSGLPGAEISPEPGGSRDAAGNGMAFSKEGEGLHRVGVSTGESSDGLADLKLMTERRLIGKEALEEGLELASKLEKVQAGAVLMEYRSRAFPEKNSQTFSLDW